MPLTDQIKNLGRKIVEAKPDDATLARLVRKPKPLVRAFSDDGIVPNHPRFPFVLYRGAVRVQGAKLNAATIVDALFSQNGWGWSWRDSVYDFVHYHSQIHEVMGVARGSARLEIGGIKGKTFTVRAGDVAILPAGTGHRLIEASRDFQVVGAYPPDGSYDECTDTRERPDAAKRIAQVPRPRTDPVYGKAGPLARLWKASRR